MAEFTMPSLGADMDEGTLLEWLVSPGDEVTRGDVVAVVETAKSTIEVECFASGTVETLLVDAGTTVPVGTPLAVITAPPAAGAPEAAAPAAAEPTVAEPLVAEPTVAEPPAAQPSAAPPSAPEPPAAEPPAAEPPVAPPSAPEPPAPEPPAAEPPAPEPPAPAPPAPPAPGRAPPRRDGGSRASVTPLVRRLAEERGVDLEHLRGSGSGGRVTRSDVERAARRPERRVRASPLARRLAEDLGVDLGLLHGTGRHGTVRADDVRRAAEEEQREEPSPAPPPVPAPSEKPPPSAEPAAPAGPPERPRTREDRSAAMRRSIAELMARSNREIPHYYLAETIDLSAALTWMAEQNRRSPVERRLVPAALLLKAAALAARRVPELNGFWLGDGFEPGDGVHLGVAVSLRGGGLLAPALRDADTLPVHDLMAALKDLVARARTGRLRGSETADPTLTVTNLGDQGVSAVWGVIYPPQVALVGLGRVVEQAVAADGLLGVRPCVTATLSADHRASDGATGARYLATMGRLLQKPEEL